MGLYLGLRSIEVVKAKWRMIDFSKKVFRNEDTKGKESDCIPMSDEMVAWFLKLKDKVGTVKPTDTIILDEDKKPAIRAFTRYAMEIAGKEVLGQKLSSHDMRRTFIMTLYYNGIKLDVIQRLARHKNIATTLQYIQENKEDEVAAIDQAFNKPSKTTENTVKKVS
jgi:integrase